jgi:hypothetical protein
MSEDDTHRTLFERQAHINKEKEKEGQAAGAKNDNRNSVQVLDKGKGRAEGEVPVQRISAVGADSADSPPVQPASAEETAPPANAAAAIEELSTPATAASPPKAEVAPAIPAVQPGVPVMAEPKDSDDEDEPFQPPSHSTAQQPQHAAFAPEEDNANSTADILDSYAGAEDQPIAGAATTATGGAAGISSGASGLKRATSGDTSGSGSRLRGPRGARGPRPAGARAAVGAGEDEEGTGRDSPVGGGMCRPSSSAR